VSEGSEPRDAATVLLVRDRDAGGIEVFMVRRHAKSGFMGGAHVFPGGKLDEADVDPALLARTRGRDEAAAAASLGEDIGSRALGLFVAAVRETFEESGVLLADLPAGTDVGAAWKRLEGGEPFGALLASLDATLRLDLLVPHARWITPAVEPRRYDTRFFLALAPADQVASHDRHEITDAEWLGPADALARERAGDITLPPPTMRTLELLGRFDRAAELLADAATRRPPLVRPVFHALPEGLILALPGDALHPEPEPVMPGGTRFVLEQGRWWSRDGRPYPGR
jgi:8-oxo-dGTP pyrophosphatase MutT (NUDIX family)